MFLRHSFKPYVGRHSVGNVYVDGCADELQVGVKTIPLENFEAKIIASLMESKSGLSREELRMASHILSVSLFEQVFDRLMDKLSKTDVANYGGNGSFFEETIYASELIREKDGLYSFYHDLAHIMGKRKPVLSDAQLFSIHYQPKASL